MYITSGSVIRKYIAHLAMGTVFGALGGSPDRRNTSYRAGWVLYVDVSRMG